MDVAKIGRIIEGVAWSQIYDRMFVSEHEELCNEAWIAILDSQKWVNEMTPGLVYTIAWRAIVRFKQWRRSSLSVGSPQFAIKHYGLEYLVALSDEAFKTFGVQGNEKDASLRIVRHKVESEMCGEDLVAIYMIQRGDDRTRIWKTFERFGYKSAKWCAFNLDRIKEIWEKYL